MRLPWQFNRLKPLAGFVLLLLAVAARAWAVAPSDPTPDSAAPNIFYGSIPPDGAQAPVLVFVHDLKGKAADWWVGNDMYSDAYAAGFRTAFVSLNADNTPNDQPWSQNGVVLKGLFPKIAVHFNARNFYVVAHSKGGLDVQAALLTPDYTALDPAIAPLVKALFMLATPNQGTALADWAFGPGQALAQRYGLLGPGLQSLEVATVLNFRSQADPVFTASQFQFYTFAGDSWAGNSMLQYTGQLLAGLTPGPNDGFVPVSSVRLSYAYSMDIGETGSNHFQMNQGHVSFGVVNGSVQGLEREIQGFRKLMTGGFGDASNTWIWSMKWFNHKLYVGTGREVNCIVYAALDAKRRSHLYPPRNGNCPADPKDLRLAAEIWQYTPETNTWIRVFQSPENIPIGNDASGQPVNTARDIGFRSMAVFTEPDGTQSLYVSGVSSGELFSDIPPYNTQGYPPPRILRTTDGVNFTALPQDPGTFLGDLSLKADPAHPVYGFRSMVAFNGKLFLVTTDYYGSGVVIGSSNPSAGNNAWFQASTLASQFPVWTVDVFAGHLWAIGGNRFKHSGYFVSYTDAQGPPPYSFTNVISTGGDAIPDTAAQFAPSSMVFDGHLYVGTSRPCELVRVNPDLSWDLVVGNPRTSQQGQKNPISGIDASFDNQFNHYFWGMAVVPSGAHKGLILGTFDSSSDTQIWPAFANLAEPNFGADLMSSPDGVQWKAITTTGFGDGLNYGIRAIESTPFGTFVGTTRAVGGSQIWLDQSALDFNNDGVIDQPDVAAVQSAVGQGAAQPYDPRDLDQDGQITPNDVRLITSQCTFPNCVADPNAPVLVAAPANLTAATTSASGNTVKLNWDPAPGAADYRVYRQTQVPLGDFFPPQGIQITIFGMNLTIPQDILNGKLNTFCPPGATATNPICRAITTVEQALLPGSPIGLPIVVTYLGRTSSTAYQEQAPTPLQSIYFVRAEDANGNLSEPSNVVGAPSDASPASTGQPGLIISSGPLAFSTQVGSATPIPSQSIQVSSNSTPLQFTAAATVTTPAGGNWLQVSPAAGTAPSSPAMATLTVTANAGGLAVGSYSGTILITDPSGNGQNVAVTLTVTPVGGSALVVGPTSLAFGYQIGGTAPAPQKLMLYSTGLPLGFTTSASVKTPKGGSWLQILPARGTAPGSPANITLTATVTPKGLPAGTYQGSININAAGGSVLQVAVTLKVSPSTGPPAAPPVTPDPTQPNLFYGAIPPNGLKGPVIVFVHGLSGAYKDWLEITGNDMYDLSYQAGFRTAFMSLNLDNSPNNADIQTNAAMLQTMFPKILSHFQASKVYFVCHSKGGLDLQAAIANTQWIGIASAVFTLGTPNQGDALADWLFSPAGNQIGQTLGLLNAGVQSLETSNVQQLRSQWDPIFQNAHIPFYTTSGDTFDCSGQATCPTAITGPILKSLTGGSNAPPNDGLVTKVESMLPTTYAMQLGVIHTMHFALRLGVHSFPFIFARVMAQETEQPGFSMLSNGGFGDEHNTWAWSMQWYKGKLYVGTGREISCVSAVDAALLTGLPLYPPPNYNCPADYHHLALQAEIWQYTPTTHTWVRVFQSPNSLETTDNNGNTVMTARDIGFRGMTVVNEPDGTQALYAGGVTSGAMFAPVSDHGQWAPPRVLRSVDGVNWAPLPQDPGTFLGSLSLNGTQVHPIYSIRAATQYNGTLFLQVGDLQGTGRVISTLPGANPATGNDAFQWASPPAEQLPIWILEQYNNFLYAGTGFPNGSSQYGVYKTDASGTPDPVNGYTWSPVVTNGAYATGLIANYAMSMKVFSDPTGCPGIGCLYVGTDRPTELIRIHPDDSWDLVIGNPRTIPSGQPGAGQTKAPISGIGQYFGNGFNGHFWRMGVGGKGLYLSTWDSSDDDSQKPPLASYWSQEFGTDVFRTSDGVHWEIMTKIAFGDGANIGGRSYASTPFGLFWGTVRHLGGTQIFMMDNSVLDYNHDGVIDQNDVNLLAARLNTTALPNDPMDLDEDGKITEQDLNALTTQCTNPGCAVPSALPTYITQPAPTLSSAPGPLGGRVSLRWNAVAGAHHYLVYRITTATTVNGPPVSSPAGVTDSQLAAGCNASESAAETDTCDAVLSNKRSALYGYPGPVIMLARVTGTSYTEPSPTSLQSLYLVRAEDSSGNLSAPSNVVGGPSLGGVSSQPSGSLAVAPSSLTFSYQLGGALPGPQNIQLSSSGGSVSFTAAASISTPPGGSWLRVSPSSGNIPATGPVNLQVTIDATGLVAGSYSGTIGISGGSQGPQQVGVTLTVTPPATSGTGNSLVLSTNQLVFDYAIGNPAPPSQSFTISSKNPLPFALTLDSASSTCWQYVGSGCLNITFDKSSGTTPGSNSSVVVNVWVNPVNITFPGMYSGNVNVSSPGESTPQILNVTVNATAGPAVGPLQGSNPAVTVADGSGWKTTLLLMNTDTQAQPFSVDFFGSDGSAAALPLGTDGTTSTVADTVSPGGLRIIQTDGAAPSLEWASASLSAAAAIQGTAILQAQFGAQTSQAAVALNSAASPKLFLPFDQTSAGSSLSTGIGLTNPGSSNALAVLSFVDDKGATIPVTGTITIPANGSYNAALGDVFPPLKGKRGVVQVNAQSNLTGMAMRFNGNAFTAMQALSNVPQGSKTVRHVANGVGWKTTLLLINADRMPASFTLSFFTDSGTPLMLPLGPDGNTSTVSGVIAPGESRTVQTDGSGVFAEGSAALATSFAIGGTAVFTFQASGQPPTETTAPITADASTDLYLPFDQTGNGSWEIALANPGSQAAFVTLTFTDESGNNLPASISSFSIPSNGHSVINLGTSQLTGKSGIVHVKSSFPLAGSGMQFNGAGYVFVPALMPSPAGN